MTGRGWGWVTGAVGVLACLAAGATTALATLALHDRWWGMAIAAVATASALWALPRGWPRPSFALGWVALVALAVLGRPEGDYAVSSEASGYLLLAGAVAVLVTGVASVGRLRVAEEAGDPASRP